MQLDLRILYRFAFFTSLLGIIAFIFDIGFYHSLQAREFLHRFYYFVLIAGLVATFARYIQKITLFKRKSVIFDLLSVLFTFFIFYIHLVEWDIFQDTPFFKHTLFLKLAVLLTFIREFSEVRVNYKRTLLNPAQLFVLSFLAIILLGTFLLMLPRATHSEITFVNALFTSTSAVCVTGLIVVDTSSYFTEFGQLIILFLIQIGGLGILTFASYFSYFFKGGTSYENQLVLGDLSNSSKLGEVFSTLKYVLITTFSVELVSAILIYSSMDGQYFRSQYEQLFFAGFHSISAFCNAGFSTLPNGLFEAEFRYNYYMQFIVILTFVFGGLGFPIVTNVVNYIKYHIKRLVSFGRHKSPTKPWVLNINSRITLITTLSISAVAFVLFYIIEYHNTLGQHEGIGKVVAALFGATTPRTAGFNTIDMSTMMLPTTIMVIVLMWIGASPSSTGGGIKTSTFAIAILNTVSLVRGKTRIEVFRREISFISVRRAFAIITLSLIIIGLGIIVISIFEENIDLLSIAFECFSAYSTVGLTLGITAKLTVGSKLVLIVIMFVGRVSMLSLLLAVVQKSKHKNYRFPTEEITIN